MALRQFAPMATMDTIRTPAHLTGTTGPTGSTAASSSALARGSVGSAEATGAAEDTTDEAVTDVAVMDVAVITVGLEPTDAVELTGALMQDAAAMPAAVRSVVDRLAADSPAAAVDSMEVGGSTAVADFTVAGAMAAVDAGNWRQLQQSLKWNGWQHNCQPFFVCGKSKAGKDERWM